MLEHDRNIPFICMTLEEGDCPAPKVREFYYGLAKPLDPDEKIPVDDQDVLDSICRDCAEFEPKVSRKTIEGYDIHVEVGRQGEGWQPKAIRVDHPTFKGRLLPPPDLPVFSSVNDAYEVGEAIFTEFLQMMDS